jgi:tetratricopeptide (TPR) repeat protein
MPLDDEPSDAKPADHQFKQTAVSNVTARDIQIGQLVQKIVYWGLPFNSRHLRFVQVLANSAYLTCLLAGFIRLWQSGADFTTLLLLILGSGLLSLTCLYYAWFWRPEVQDKSAPDSELPDSDERVKAQRTRQQSRQRTRRLAIVGFVVIPLLTCAGFFVWQSLPPPNVLLLVADFDGVEQQNYQVTENILRNLRKATESYADVRVQALNQPITEQQGSEVARTAGKQRKASIVIWGDYGVTPTNVQISVHFEVLKPPKNFPELGKTARGEAQTAAIAELNSFKLQTHLSSEMSYLTLFTLGTVQYARKDWQGAGERFTAALEQMNEPTTTLDQEIVYFYRANSRHHKNDYQSAIADYNQALRLNPDYVGAYNNRGLAYDNQGKFADAIADFNQAIHLKPDLAEAYYNRGLAYADQGKYAEAIADFNQAIHLKPDFAEAYNGRGFSYDNQGKYAEAIADFNQAIRLKPDFAWAYNGRGIAYDNQGKYAEAIAEYNQAIHLKPDLAETYNGRGLAYADQGKYAEAITDFNQAIYLKPDFAEAYYNKACVYSLRREAKAAIENLQQAIDLEPKAREFAKTDHAFDNIRQDKQFQALVGK